MYQPTVRSSGVSIVIPSSAAGSSVVAHVSGRDRKSASLLAVPGRCTGVMSDSPKPSQATASSAPKKFKAELVFENFCVMASAVIESDCTATETLTEANSRPQCLIATRMARVSTMPCELDCPSSNP